MNIVYLSIIGILLLYISHLWTVIKDDEATYMSVSQYQHEEIERLRNLVNAQEEKENNK